MLKNIVSKHLIMLSLFITPMLYTAQANMDKKSSSASSNKVVNTQTTAYWQNFEQKARDLYKKSQHEYIDSARLAYILRSVLNVFNDQKNEYAQYATGRLPDTLDPFWGRFAHNLIIIYLHDSKGKRAGSINAEDGIKSQTRLDQDILILHTIVKNLEQNSPKSSRSPIIMETIKEEAGA